MNKKTRVAIIGTGNIGTDLCYRLLRDSDFEVIAFVGRRPDSPGLKMFEGKVKYILSNGIDGLTNISDEYEGFFDATSAFDHPVHWEKLSKKNKWAIDLTPSKIGIPIVPALTTTLDAMRISDTVVANYSLITCGGQSSALIISAITNAVEQVIEVEISSSIASLSAGPATRKNIDEYINSTENLANIISGSENNKAILVLNPADPPVMMRTTVTMKVKNPNIETIHNKLGTLVTAIQEYIPGYEVVIPPHLVTKDVVSATVKVSGAGYILPKYSGNLDIITAAGIEIARMHSAKHNNRVESKL